MREATYLGKALLESTHRVPQGEVAASDQFADIVEIGLNVIKLWAEIRISNSHV